MVSGMQHYEKEVQEGRVSCVGASKRTSQVSESCQELIGRLCIPGKERECVWGGVVGGRACGWEGEVGL